MYLLNKLPEYNSKISKDGVTLSTVPTIEAYPYNYRRPVFDIGRTLDTLSHPAKYILTDKSGDMYIDYILIGETNEKPLGNQDLYLVSAHGYKNSKVIDNKPCTILYKNGISKFHTNVNLLEEERSRLEHADILPPTKLEFLPKANLRTLCRDLYRVTKDRELVKPIQRIINRYKNAAPEYLNTYPEILITDENTKHLLYPSIEEVHDNILNTYQHVFGDANDIEEIIMTQLESYDPRWVTEDYEKSKNMPFIKNLSSTGVMSKEDLRRFMACNKFVYNDIPRDLNIDKLIENATFKSLCDTELVAEVDNYGDPFYQIYALIVSAPYTDIEVTMFNPKYNNDWIVTSKPIFYNKYTDNLLHENIYFCNILESAYNDLFNTCDLSSGDILIEKYLFDKFNFVDYRNREAVPNITVDFIVRDFIAVIHITLDYDNSAPITIALLYDILLLNTISRSLIFNYR